MDISCESCARTRISEKYGGAIKNDGGIANRLIIPTMRTLTNSAHISYNSATYPENCPKIRILSTVLTKTYPNMKDKFGENIFHANYAPRNSLTLCKSFPVFQSYQSQYAVKKMELMLIAQLFIDTSGQ